jgi:hypothetical protein
MTAPVFFHLAALVDRVRHPRGDVFEAEHELPVGDPVRELCASWSAAAVPAVVGGPDDCSDCSGTGLLEVTETTPDGRLRWSGRTCWSCRGTGEAGAA